MKSSTVVTLVQSQGVPGALGSGSRTRNLPERTSGKRSALLPFTGPRDTSHWLLPGLATISPGTSRSDRNRCSERASSSGRCKASLRKHWSPQSCVDCAAAIESQLACSSNIMK